MKLAFVIVATFFVVTARCSVLHEQQEQPAQTSSNSPLKFVAVDEVADELKRSKRCACGPHGCVCKRSINNENEQTGEVASILDPEEGSKFVGIDEVADKVERSKRCACGPHGCVCKRSVFDDQDEIVEALNNLEEVERGDSFSKIVGVSNEQQRSKRCACGPHGCACKRSVNNEQEQTAEVASGLLDQEEGSRFVGVDEVADELKRSKRCACGPKDCACSV